MMLGDPLGGAHDAARAHGLVGGDEHEALDPDGDGGVDDVPGADDVGPDGLARVRPRAAARACARRRGRRPRAGAAGRAGARASGRGCRRAAAVAGWSHAWPRRRAGGSRRGRAGAARAGWHAATCRAISEPIEPPAPVMRTRRPLEQGAHRGQVGGDLGAAEQVVDAQVAERAGADPAADELLHRRKHAHREAAARRRGRRPAARSRESRRARPAPPGAPRARRRRPTRSSKLPTTRMPAQERPMLARVVVEHDDRDQAGVPVAAHAAHELGGCLAGPEDDHAHAVGRLVAPVEREQPRLEPDPAEQHRHDERPEHAHRDRERPAHRERGRRHEDGRREAGQADPARLGDARVPPDLRVEAAGPRGHEGEQNRDWKEVQQVHPLVAAGFADGPQDHHEAIAASDQDGVERRRGRLDAHPRCPPGQPQPPRCLLGNPVHRPPRPVTHRLPRP